ncbi:cyclic nucleotide-binding domain-containing protein [Salisaeta longa]|uniref:cyclic nucleotide-binding domain-containing protein n=1 Tax=Salisaeta longa TaxID=503170 RepID=UPI0003B60775|nr:cyclic nucleotide-binding domain-containing protein [Salisaeta longa]
MKKALYILGKLSDSDIDWMVANGASSEVDADTVIIRQGKPADSLYLVLNGSFMVIDEEREATVAVLESGEIVGEMSFVDEQPPSATVRSITDSTVFELPRAALEQKLDEDDEFAKRFYRAVAVFLSDRLRSTLRKDVANGDRTPKEAFDPQTMEQMIEASNRFDRFLEKLASA